MAPFAHWRSSFSTFRRLHQLRFSHPEKQKASTPDSMAGVEVFPYRRVNCKALFAPLQVLSVKSPKNPARLSSDSPVSRSCFAQLPRLPAFLLCGIGFAPRAAMK
jgi:hypothetical protein